MLASIPSESASSPGWRDREATLTGATIFGGPLDGKRLELLSELLPPRGRIAILWNPSNPAYRDPDEYFKGLQGVAHAKGLEFHKLTATIESEIDAAFRMLVQSHVDGLLLSADPLFISQLDRIVALAARHAVPAIFTNRGNVAAGGLMSYGPNRTAIDRLAGVYVARILNGETPDDLPVQQPTKFDLLVNLKTAKALGLTVPQSILARADEVIE